MVFEALPPRIIRALEAKRARALHGVADIGTVAVLK
jgi:hypothetical protein